MLSHDILSTVWAFDDSKSKVRKEEYDMEHHGHPQSSVIISRR